MAFREVDVNEVREVLRWWLDGAGLRTIAARAGVDRKTARRYVEAAQAAGLCRDAGQSALCDELIGAMRALEGLTLNTQSTSSLNAQPPR